MLNEWINFPVMKYLIAIVFFAGLAACSPTRSVTEKVTPSNPVIAHRGAWKHTGAPQNSLAALRSALQMRCGGTEFDIHMTADGIAVINHDHDLQGMAIETSTYQQLLALNLPNGEKMPTLEAYLREGGKQDYTKLVAEIKASQISKQRSLQLAQTVVEMVKRLNFESKVMYISFDYDVCQKIKELMPGAAVQYLNGKVPPQQLKADGLDADYHHRFYLDNPGWIREARATGVVVNAWTVNDPEMMDELLADSIDFITTDEPELLLRKINKR